MKHTLYISSLLAACMLLFSCAADNTAIPGNGSSKSAVVNLSLSTGVDTRANGALPTDKGSVVGSNEGTLNHICVGLFDANNKLVTLYEYNYNGDQSIPTRTDAVKMLVFANVPVGAFAGKYILSDFYTVAQDLGYTTSADGKIKTGVTTANSQSMKSLPMMSDVQTLNWASGTTLNPSVTLNRLVARVALTNISYSFSGSYTGCSFTPKEIFMYNASNQLTNWNTKAVSGSVSGENIAANANTAYLGSGTISSFSSTSPYYFYVFPNSNTTAPTKLVIKGTFTTKSGTTYTTYYPITVNSSSATGNIVSTITGGTGDSKISANTTYGLSATISGTGVNSVSDELAATNVTVTTSVDSYTNAIISEVFPIPHIGDIYYSDGSYSSTYNSSKTPIGIIVSTNSNYCEDANGYGHGLVMALKNASTGTPWKTENTTGGLNYVSVLSKMYTDVSGLNNSKIITMTNSTYPAFYAIGTYTTSVSTPKNCSGWFLPSIGQWWDTLEQAAAYNNTALGLILMRYDSSDTAYTGGGEDVVVANALTYLLTSHSLPSSLYTTFSSGMWYWSSSESSAANACHIAFYNNTFALYGTNKYDSGGRVRAFLAF
ncbi:hypothetical protein [Segatella paludivivens]|uniref:hypothetical protein n=1 Tax=Segatella paludivivens TaxID=185294 RepID=UPI00035D216D|nr:hypothetical protein [Segatella paludivivens]